MRAMTRRGGPEHSSSACMTCRPVTSRALEPNQRCAWTHSPRRSSSMKPRSLIRVLLDLLLGLGVGLPELEPEEAPRRERQEVWQLADPREARAAEHLLRVAARILAQIELDRLCGARHVVDAQDDVVLVAADVGEDLVVRRLQRLVRPEAEDRVRLAQ